MGTKRIQCIAHGNILGACFLGFFEMICFIWASAEVIMDFHNFWKVAAWAGGFSGGTWLGMVSQGLPRPHQTHRSGLERLNVLEKVWEGWKRRSGPKWQNGGLLACPFCGQGGAKLILNVKKDKRICYRFECTHAPCRVVGPLRWDEEQAAKAWDNRSC